MIIYYFLLAITYFFYITKLNNYKINNTNVFLFIFSIILLVISGMRYGVGTDFFSYYNYYLNFTLLDGVFEPFYNILNYLSYRISDNPQFLIFITSFIIIGLVYISINRFSINSSMSVVIFVFGFFYFDSMNVIRQYIAAVIILFAAHQYLLRNKNLFFIFSVVLATLFHYSAAFSIIMLLFKKIKFKRYFAVPYLVIVVILVPFLGRIQNFLFSIVNELPIVNEYIVYDQFRINLNASPYDFILYSLIFLIAAYAFNGNYINEKKAEYNFYLNSMAVVVALKALSLENKFFDRLTLYFTIFIIFLLPLTIKALGIKERKSIEVLIIVFFMIYAFVRIYTGQAGVINYDIFINHK
ncbi:hypothetical protein GMD78_03245 [Ornithinibacillus sp. L9]|uniref:EpsG family protein n=1 Tax=Ornithinibacillus caprae TaxID=2678566 RepID=A0A6N8FH74_9BACI|nr:EpsG family protein [Ornithinibacillus caprae]MUK87417.1 hypothetical protein [Ornithinibacillus caprae]